ncbi:MAG: sigma 54-interacting transcriptional regulator [Desulfobulbus sp.]|jgi:DNA-binding NtrC family response regulator/pSer/pThr/pTyr-binding forkhead associated (FHA) protein|uniref:sigma 54-interacting transcriptional regulator n=1 Tax=Desulfobulbus sp. TaxID=895 RepID=UPI00283BA178|nr:sigma 54-interacting transcriptional regulator [Desulfobulbus sp.]MDR2551289.1 sigma 54-interacting transcriptional regulator [Desulfobulbus sp.]
MPSVIVCQDAQNYRVVECAATLTIGREGDNDIVLASPQVSRQHASIALREGGDFMLFDHESTNGVWMEGRRVSGVLLRHGMAFRIGDHVFTFIDERSGSRAPRVFPAEDESGSAENRPDPATVLFSLETGSPVRLSAELPLDDRVAGTAADPATTLAPLLVELQLAEDEGALGERLLAGAVGLAGAQRGFLALLSDRNELLYAATHGFDPLRESREVNQEVVRQVMDRGIAVRLDGGPDVQLRKGKTQAQSVLAAPLMRMGRAVGCLYLDHREACFFAPAAQGALAILAVHGAVLLDNLAGRQRMHRERESLKARLVARDETVVRSEKMIKLYEDIRTIAAINVPVFIQGEAGSGKEHVASALHAFSGRKGTYVPLNCAAIPEGIFESELFGSRKGAYHEAIDKPGKLELAEGGTLFLDEVADMALTLQPKLLRFLENGEVTRLGDTRTRKLDVRVVTATNRDVAAMIRDNLFRDDLFQRLSCFTLKVPPLRERIEDIEPLIRYFLAKFAAEYRWQEPKVSDGALELFSRYPWPGNVRQLRNLLLRLAVQSQGKPIGEREVLTLSEEFGTLEPARIEVFPGLEEVEKNHIKAALERAGGNISDAAALVGIARSTLYQKMKKYDISV